MELHDCGAKWNNRSGQISISRSCVHVLQNTSCIEMPNKNCEENASPLPEVDDGILHSERFIRPTVRLSTEDYPLAFKVIGESVDNCVDSGSEHDVVPESEVEFMKHSLPSIYT